MEAGDRAPDGGRAGRIGRGGGADARRAACGAARRRAGGRLAEERDRIDTLEEELEEAQSGGPLGGLLDGRFGGGEGGELGDLLEGLGEGGEPGDLFGGGGDLFGGDLLRRTAACLGDSSGGLLDGLLGGGDGAFEDADPAVTVERITGQVAELRELEFAPSRAVGRSPRTRRPSSHRR